MQLAILSWSPVAYAIEDDESKSKSKNEMELFIGLLSSVLRLTNNSEMVDLSEVNVGNSTQLMTNKFDEFMSKIMSPVERLKCINSDEIQYLTEKAKICKCNISSHFLLAVLFYQLCCSNVVLEVRTAAYSGNWFAGSVDEGYDGGQKQSDNSVEFWIEQWMKLK